MTALQLKKSIYSRKSCSMYKTLLMKAAETLLFAQQFVHLP